METSSGAGTGGRSIIPPQDAGYSRATTFPNAPERSLCELKRKGAGSGGHGAAGHEPELGEDEAPGLHQGERDGAGWRKRGVWACLRESMVRASAGADSRVHRWTMPRKGKRAGARASRRRRTKSSGLTGRGSRRRVRFSGTGRRHEPGRQCGRCWFKRAARARATPPESARMNQRPGSGREWDDGAEAV